ncbi:MAG TPA: dethiobiotin synthase [Chthoniobacterales bacterium]
MNLLVTGTDTGVGKTYVTTRLVSAARAAGVDAVAAKPFCTGDAADVSALQEANGSIESDHVINAVWFRTPLAPYAAAMVENRHVDVAGVVGTLRELGSRHAHLVVEGAGGLLVPITRHYDFRSLAVDLELDVLVVAENRLGVLNHVRLTLEALAARDLTCRGVILNGRNQDPDLAAATNAGVLEQLVEVPVFAMGYQDTRPLTALARQLFGS